MSPLNHHHRSLSPNVFTPLNFHTKTSKFMFTAQMTVKNNILNKAEPHTYSETDRNQSYA